MKVTTNIPGRLIVEHKPIGHTIERTLLTLVLTGVGIWMFDVLRPLGVVFLGLAPVNVVLLAREIRHELVMFDRALATVRIVRRSSQHVTRLEVPLSLITGAEVIQTGNPADQEFSGRLVLTRDGATPLAVSEIEHPLGHLRPVAAEISAWLEAARRAG